jgi:hypothetical protein
MAALILTCTGLHMSDTLLFCETFVESWPIIPMLRKVKLLTKACVPVISGLGQYFSSGFAHVVFPFVEWRSSRRVVVPVSGGVSILGRYRSLFGPGALKHTRRSAPLAVAHATRRSGLIGSE